MHKYLKEDEKYGFITREHEQSQKGKKDDWLVVNKLTEQGRALLAEVKG